jgi:hypothetical protein
MDMRREKRGRALEYATRALCGSAGKSFSFDIPSQFVNIDKWNPVVERDLPWRHIVRKVSIRAHALPSLISVIEGVMSELTKLPVQEEEDVPVTLPGTCSVEVLELGCVMAGIWFWIASSSETSLRCDKHTEGLPRAKA